MCESQIIKERASARGNTGKGVKKMKRKCFFGIRKDLINETKSALRRKAEREKKVEEPATAEQAEEMAKDAEILAFLELFQKQDSRSNCLFLRAAGGIITVRNTGTDRSRSLRCAAENWNFMLTTGNGIWRRAIS